MTTPHHHPLPTSSDGLGRATMDRCAACVNRPRAGWVLVAMWLTSFCSCQSLPSSPRAEFQSPTAELGATSQHVAPVYDSARQSASSAAEPAVGTPPSPAPPAPESHVVAASLTAPMAAPVLRSGPSPPILSGACGCGHVSCRGSGCAAGAPGSAINEYLCNGGDQVPQVVVRHDQSVLGLHAGDTVVHYDTLDGERQVSHSNDVCIYAPRFAAVRKVTGVVQHEQRQRGAGVDLPLTLVQSGDALSTNTVLQQLQPQRNLASRGPLSFRDRTRSEGVENSQRPAQTAAGFLPYEDFAIIRSGQFENSEKARLATSLAAAIVWTDDLEAQVVIDNKTAVESAANLSTQSVYRYELTKGKPCLRVVKVASSHEAKPGETLDFTIRFDNVGDKAIRNVTVIDHLITRLEYVPDSQSASLDAEFLTQENDAESLTLRWELKEALAVGEGGVIRFQCRVR